MRQKLLSTLAFFSLALVLPSAAAASPPTNDNFADASVITSLPFSDTFDSSEATTEPGEPLGCLSPPEKQTVWYVFTPSSDEVVKAETTSFVSTVLDVYRSDAPGFGGLTKVSGCHFFGEPAFVPVQAGKTYYFQVSAFPFDAGGQITFDVQAVPPPPNDDFGGATQVSSLPFSDTVDANGATTEPGEPTPSCGYGTPASTVWYAFKPATSGSVTATSLSQFNGSEVAAYTGSSLVNLTGLGCRAFGSPLTIHVDAGTTYYFQVAGLFGPPGQLTFNLAVTPPPTAQFGFSPSDPSIFDTVQFNDSSFDPGGVGIQSEAWDLGDGTTATGCCPSHHYAADADYTVKLTVETPDGRSATTTQIVHVKTHDVAIAKLVVPQSASAGQTRSITVGISNKRYPETVQVELMKSTTGGFVTVGTLTQSVPVRSGNRTTDFHFSYTFTGDDAALGKVTFQAVATILGAKDAEAADNTATALPTKVSG